MIKFIEFISAEGKLIYLNVTRIEAVVEIISEGTTRICTTEGNDIYWSTKESYDSVKQKVINALQQ